MKMKKFLASILATVMLMSMLTIGASATSPTFTDVPETHWAYESIEEAAAAGIVNGIGNNLYGPNNTVTFVQFATMITRYFMPQNIERAQAQLNYDPSDSLWWQKPDVEPPFWWYLYVRALELSDWQTMVGTKPYDTFVESGARLSDPELDTSLLEAGITRYDMAVMMYNIMLEGFLPEDTTVSTATKNAIADWDSIPSNYQLAVARCYEAKLLSGVDSKGTFNGEGIMNRAQAATVMCRLIAYKNGEDIGSDDGDTENSGVSTVDGGKDANGYTTAASVNSIKDRGKSDAYPTMGGAAYWSGEEYAQLSDSDKTIVDKSIEMSQAVSVNGYYTGSTVDAGNSVLVYEFLDMVNTARKAEGLPELKWVGSDATEEYTLIRAKDITINFSHFGQHAGMCNEVIAWGAGDAASMFESWMESEGHRNTIMTTDNTYMCAAKNGACWIIAFYDDIITGTCELNTDDYIIGN